MFSVAYRVNTQPKHSERLVDIWSDKTYSKDSHLLIVCQENTDKSFIYFYFGCIIEL